jgi:hypothetical protein
MNQCNVALNANINQKEQPNSLYVHGSVMVYTAATEVHIEKAEPQGINPAILLLKLTVVERPGPMKGVARPFFYTERGDHVNSYQRVQLVSNLGDDCVVSVEVFGWRPRSAVVDEDATDESCVCPTACPMFEPDSARGLQALRVRYCFKSGMLMSNRGITRVRAHSSRFERTTFAFAIVAAQA